MDNMIRVKKIIEYIDKIIEYTKDFDYESFQKDELVQDACFMNLTQIGEQANNIDDSFIDLHKDIKWKEMKGLRNRIVHDYDGVNMQIIWDTMRKDLPELKNKLNGIF